MIETVWIAFACGLVIGSCLGILTLALIIAGKNEDLQRDNERLRQTRQLLKEEEIIRKIIRKNCRFFYEVFIYILFISV